MYPGTMPFGKHYGERLSEVPLQYLVWALREIGASLNQYCPTLHEEIADEVARRREARGQARGERAGAGACAGAAAGSGACGDLPAVLGPVIARWYRQLARRWHPDAGGNTLAMQVVNDAHDRLKQLVGMN